MERATVCVLIKDSPTAHGVFEPHMNEERTVFCTVRSVSMRETYEAMAAGVTPEAVIRLEHDFEYHNEKRLRIGETEYDIIRTYAGDQNGIELTVKRREGNADV